MSKLINSSTGELVVKYERAVRGSADAVLLALGFLAGVVGTTIANMSKTSPWWGILPIVGFAIFWGARAFVIYRIAAQRQKGWQVDAGAPGFSAVDEGDDGEWN